MAGAHHVDPVGQGRPKLGNGIVAERGQVDHGLHALQVGLVGEPDILPAEVDALADVLQGLGAEIHFVEDPDRVPCLQEATHEDGPDEPGTAGYEDHRGACSIHTTRPQAQGKTLPPRGGVVRHVRMFSRTSAKGGGDGESLLSSIRWQISGPQFGGTTTITRVSANSRQRASLAKSVTGDHLHRSRGASGRSAHPPLVPDEDVAVIIMGDASDQGAAPVVGKHCGPDEQLAVTDHGRASRLRRPLDDSGAERQYAHRPGGQGQHLASRKLFAVIHRLLLLRSLRVNKERRRYEALLKGEGYLLVRLKQQRELPNWQDSPRKRRYPHHAFDEHRDRRDVYARLRAEDARHARADPPMRPLWIAAAFSEDLPGLQRPQALRRGSAQDEDGRPLRDLRRHESVRPA